MIALRARDYFLCTSTGIDIDVISSVSTCVDDDTAQQLHEASKDRHSVQFDVLGRPGYIKFLSQDGSASVGRQCSSTFGFIVDRLAFLPILENPIEVGNAGAQGRDIYAN